MRTIFFIIGWLPLFAQAQNITGEWSGYLDQKTNPLKQADYAYFIKKKAWKTIAPTHQLTLSFRQKNKAFTGSYFIKDTDDSTHFGNIPLRGTLRNDTVYYETVGGKKTESYRKDQGFCYNTATLRRYTQNGYEFLEGAWDGKTGNDRKCAPAWIVVWRKAAGITPTANMPKNLQMLNNRPTIIIEKPIVVTQKVIRIAIYDGQKEDGDSISINLNGKWILQDYEMKIAKKEVQLPLQMGDNFITVFAKNLGRLPPNTVMIDVMDGTEVSTVTLSANMQQNEGLRLIRKR